MYNGILLSVGDGMADAVGDGMADAVVQLSAVLLTLGSY